MLLFFFSLNIPSISGMKIKHISANQFDLKRKSTLQYNQIKLFMLHMSDENDQKEISIRFMYALINVSSYATGAKN